MYTPEGWGPHSFTTDKSHHCRCEGESSDYWDDLVRFFRERGLSKGDPRDLFIEVLKSAGDVPLPLSAAAADVQSCEESAFDESYIEFLDTQIRLSPRGPEWTQRLRRRRSGLSPYCGMLLVRGRVRTAASEYSVYVDPTRRVVVYWEEYPLGE